MATDLQRRFFRSGIFRRYCEEIAAVEGAPYKGYKRLWQDLIKAAVPLPEPRIKMILYLALTCCDVSTIERQEVQSLLESAETTLTAEQRESLKQQLND